MLSFIRMAMAAIHWNANAGRQQASTKDGTLRFAVQHRKANEGAASLHIVYEDASYGMYTKIFIVPYRTT